MNDVIAEGRWSAATERVTGASERRWIASLAPRGAAFVAETEGEVVAFQTIEPFSAYLKSMRHVGVVGTQVASAWRGRGIGSALWEATKRFAFAHGYEKALAYVRKTNARALRFYRNLGFRDVGVLRRQVRIAGRTEDEVLLEVDLTRASRSPRAGARRTRGPSRPPRA